MKPIRIELNLTYRCNLHCRYCNKSSNVAPVHTPDIQLPEFADKLRQLKLKMTPYEVVLIGGEPTLHPQILEFPDLIRSIWTDCRVTIFSNGYTEETRKVLGQLEKMNVSNWPPTVKTSGGAIFPWRTWQLMRSDGGQPPRIGPCRFQPFGEMNCGFSIDSIGIGPCPITGTLDGIFDLGVRTWDWDEVLSMRRLPELCRFCGADTDGMVFNGPIFNFRGQPVSKTWFEALTRLEQKNKETAA